MSVMRTLILAGMASLISAYTPPTNATWGALLTPDTTHPVTQGQSFTVTWDPAGHSTDGVTVSLVLCKGPSTNCVAQSTAIVEGVPASQKSYNWAVPCSLTPGVQATETGYGMLIIVDGTGEFQYSTQFSVLANPTCAAVSSAPAVSSSVSPSAPASQSSAPAPNPSNTWEYWSSSSAAAVSSSPASSAPVKTTVSTIVTSAVPVSASSSKMTTHAPVPTSAITSAAVSASSSKPVSTFTGAAPQITSGAIGVVAAAAFAVFAL